MIFLILGRFFVVFGLFSTPIEAFREPRTARQAFRDLDLDKDGKVSRQELRFFVKCLPKYRLRDLVLMSACIMHVMA